MIHEVRVLKPCLVEFAKLRKGTLSFVTSVCRSVHPSARMLLSSCSTNFHKIWYLSIFRKSVEKIQVSLKSKRIMGTLHKDQNIFYHILLSYSQNEKCSAQNLQRKSKDAFYIQQTFFENRAVYEILQKSNTEPARQQMTIRCIRVACSIPKATNKHLHYLTLIYFPLQQCLHERASTFRYAHISCLV